MTRDQVIEAAKDWILLLKCEPWSVMRPEINGTEGEQHDVLKACVDLAYNRTKEKLVSYAKNREKQFAEHDRMLDSIEAALQQEFKNGV